MAHINYLAQNMHNMNTRLRTAGPDQEPLSIREQKLPEKEVAPSSSAIEPREFANADMPRLTNIDRPPD